MTHTAFKQSEEGDMEPPIAPRRRQETPQGSRPPAYRYHLLRAALEAGHGGLAGLQDRALEETVRRADKSFELETLVVASPEAADVIVAPERIDQAVDELVGRYPDRPSFLADLQRNGLDLDALQSALGREMIFDACMQRVAAKRPKAGELDERLFHELHRDRFTEPERRTVRHILITVNEEFVDNRRDAALARVDRLAVKLEGRSTRFPSLARKHSECPSAMEGGLLGTVSRGKLYPELDAVLFRLEEGEVSSPVESELGFHLLWCEKIQRGRTVPFSKARPRIRELLDRRAARNCQKAWIAQLRRAAGADATHGSGGESP